MTKRFATMMSLFAVVMMVVGFSMVASAENGSCTKEGSCSKTAAVKSASCPVATGAAPACASKDECPKDSCSDKKCSEKKEKSNSSTSCSDSSEKKESSSDAEQRLLNRFDPFKGGSAEDSPFFFLPGFIALEKVLKFFSEFFFERHIEMSGIFDFNTSLSKLVF